MSVRFKGMERRVESLKERGALVRLLLGVAIAVILSLVAWLTQQAEWTVRSGAAVLLLVFFAIVGWVLILAADAVAKGIEGQ